MEEALAFRGASGDSNSTSDTTVNNLGSLGLNSSQSAEGEVHQTGFQQLGHIIDQSAERAAFLIKQWLYSEDLPTRELLTVIPRQLGLEQLNRVLSLLNQEDRKRWNQINGLHLQTRSIPILDQVIAQKISDHLIEPSLDIDEETKQLIASMTPQEGVAAIRSDSAFGSLLASAMPSLQYSRVLSLLDPPTIRAVAEKSFEIGAQDLKYIAIKLTKNLEQIRGQSRAKRTFFTEKVPQLIQELGYEKEAALFDSLASSGDLDLLQKTSLDFFPADLIDQLPTEILKDVLDSMELAKKAELISSQPQHGSLLLTALGDGRLREVLEVEINDLKKNAARFKRVQRQATGLWQEFIDQVRKRIRNSSEIKEDLHDTLTDWCRSRVVAMKPRGSSSEVA